MQGHQFCFLAGLWLSLYILVLVYFLVSSNEVLSLTSTEVPICVYPACNWLHDQIISTAILHFKYLVYIITDKINWIHDATHDLNSLDGFECIPCVYVCIWKMVILCVKLSWESTPVNNMVAVRASIYTQLEAPNSWLGI